MPLNFYASAGHKFEAQTIYNGGGSWTFFFWNFYTNATLTIHTTNNRYSGATAEAITERPSLGGPLDMMKFDTFTMEGIANNSAIGNSSHVKVGMYNGDRSHRLVTTGALEADNESFTETWQACN